MEYSKSAEFVMDSAVNAGFDDCGIAPAFPVPVDRQAYESYIRAGLNSDMAYLADTIEQRFNPGLLLAGVKSVVVCVAAYKSSLPGLAARPADSAFISRYAWGRDYHRVVKDRLNAMVGLMRPVIGGAWLPLVDIGPVFEKAYANQAGLGFIGKNSLLVHPVYGSFVFLGVLLTDIVLAPTGPMLNQACANCTKCVDSCPAGALRPPFLDANKCIGHLNNMYRGPMPEINLRANLFGCDICQDVCPYNKNTPVNDESPFMPEHDYNRFPEPDFLMGLSNRGLRKIFSGTSVAIQRPRRLKEIAGIIAEGRDQ